MTCKKDPHKYTADNDMDPLHPRVGDVHLFHQERLALPQLSAMEEALIAKNCVIMQGYRLRGGGTAFKGNVISFPQDINDICLKLPRLPSSLNIVIARCKKTTEADIESFIDFKVRRKAVHEWLLFLKKWSNVYADISINETVLSQLPIDGSIFKEVTKNKPFEKESKVTCDEHVDHEEDSNTCDFDDDNDEHVSNDDFGANSGPLNDMLDDDEDDVLYTSINGESSTNISEDDLIKQEILNWPNRSDIPNDEYSMTYLLASSFPTLFPCGAGDVTCRLYRKNKVRLSDAIKHYVKYYDPILKSYPFASHARFLHYIQDMDERNRIQTQCSVYLKKTPCDSELTLKDLAEMCRRNDPNSSCLMNRMSRYGENILGSAAYFAKHKKKLLTLIERKGPPTFWFTLSLPNWHWESLQVLAGENGPKDKKEWRVWFHNNPHLVDEYFVKRAETYLDTFFPRDDRGMSRSWL